LDVPNSTALIILHELMINIVTLLLPTFFQYFSSHWTRWCSADHCFQPTR